MNRLPVSLVPLAAVFLLVCTKGVAEERPSTAKGDQQAKALALRVHRQAAEMDNLRQYYYQNRVRVGDVDTMRDVEGRSVHLLKKALDEVVRDEDWQDSIVTVFAWDEKRFLSRRSDFNSNDHRFWTRARAWRRYQPGGKPASFVIDNTAKEIWEKTQLPSLPYVKVTPHRLWWGDTTQGYGKTNSFASPEAVSYRYIQVEPFGGEMCDVVESAGRKERLWIGCDSSRLRGVLQYNIEPPFEPPFYRTKAITRVAGRGFSSQGEFQQWVEELDPARRTELVIAFNETYFESNARPHGLIRFDDYREVAPGVWIPFRAELSQPSSYRERKGQYHYYRNEFVVQEVKTDVDLSKTIAELLPKEGDRISDRRFAVPVSYDYRADLTRGDILKLVSARQQEIAQSQRLLKRFTEPIEAMVGKPAPRLPVDGWIGAERPKLEGTPYLIHFWATWCAPCKKDLPRLKKLAEGDVTVIGIHPPGTAAKDVEKLIFDKELGYPTLLVSPDNDESEDLAGYPVKTYPYCIVVDEEGNVAAHGFLRKELLARIRSL